MNKKTITAQFNVNFYIPGERKYQELYTNIEKVISQAGNSINYLTPD